MLRALNAYELSRVNVIAASGSDSTPRTWKAVWETYRWGFPRAIARWVANRLKQWVSCIRAREVESSDSLEIEVQAQGGQFVCVKDINGQECRQALQALKVDLMILAGTSIVRAPILEVPCLGTLNAHQGELPRFRGMNVIEWSVLEGYQPTISVHFVDPGVDTGDIIATESVPLQLGDTLSDVRQRASGQQPDLLARTACKALAGSLPGRPQHPEEGRQYFSMHPRLRGIAEQRLQERMRDLSQGEVHGSKGTAVPQETANTVLAHCTS